MLLETQWSLVICAPATHTCQEETNRLKSILKLLQSETNKLLEAYVSTQFIFVTVILSFTEH